MVLIKNRRKKYFSYIDQEANDERDELHTQNHTEPVSLIESDFVLKWLGKNGTHVIADDKASQILMNFNPAKIEAFNLKMKKEAEINYTDADLKFL
jgi:hypothetical protein